MSHVVKTCFILQMQYLRLSVKDVATLLIVASILTDSSKCQLL